MSYFIKISALEVSAGCWNGVRSDALLTENRYSEVRPFVYHYTGAEKAGYFPGACAQSEEHP